MKILYFCLVLALVIQDKILANKKCVFFHFLDKLLPIILQIITTVNNPTQAFLLISYLKKKNVVNSSSDNIDLFCY